MKTTDFHRKRMLAAAVSGLLLTAAFPKIGYDLVAWAALVPLLWAVEGTRVGGAFRIGFVFGLAHFMSLVYWVVPTIQTYGHLPLWLAFPILFLFAAVLALFPALFAMGVSLVSTGPALLWSAVPVFWTAQEMLRARLFTGFPWELVGHSQFERIVLIQIADIAGVHGVSFLIVLVNAALYTLVTAVAKSRPDAGRRRRRAAMACLVASGAAAGTLGYGAFRLSAIEAAARTGETVRVALVQGNIAQELKWDRKFQRETTEKYARLSVSAQKDAPDLVIWPETATPFYFPFHGPLSRIVFDAVRRTGADFLIGSPSFEEEDGGLVYFNSAYLVSADGTVKERYDKVHLVPFGEYVPFQRYLPFLGKIVEHVGDFQSGPEGKNLAWQNRLLGVLICYESIFPELGRAQAAAGADLLVNITNDAWYGRSSAPFQHFSMAVFRAVENRLPVVRAANTGISGFIDAAGRVTDQTPLFVEAVMTRPVRLASIRAPYTRFGDLFGYLCLGGSVLLVVLAAGLRKKRNL